MYQTTQIELTRKQLDNGVLSDKCNHVIIEVPYSTEGATTKSGIIVGFNRHINYAEGSDSHPADMQECWGIVYKTPDSLYYNEKDNASMEWETDMELEPNMKVWFSLIESANSHEVLCEGKIYKILPYADCYVAKKADRVIPLNGYVLCQTVNLPKLSELDVTSEDKVDKTKAIVRYVGTPNKRYKTKSYVDHQDLQPGDVVLLDRGTVLLPLERKAYMARFQDDQLFIVVPRRKVVAVLNRETKK